MRTTVCLVLWISYWFAKGNLKEMAQEPPGLFPIDFLVVLMSKSKGNYSRSLQAYFLLHVLALINTLSGSLHHDLGSQDRAIGPFPHGSTALLTHPC